jgi:hypothetical protein
MLRMAQGAGMRGVLRTVVLLVAGTVDAGAYRGLGSGTLSCGACTSLRIDVGEGRPLTNANARGVAAMQWVLGFLSGIGSMDHGNDPLDGVDALGVWAWIDNYCHANPLNDVADATTAFYYAHPHQ